MKLLLLIIHSVFPLKMHCVHCCYGPIKGPRRGILGLPKTIQAIKNFVITIFVIMHACVASLFIT
jgi:hypothetical protein